MVCSFVDVTQSSLIFDFGQHSVHNSRIETVLSSFAALNMGADNEALLNPDIKHLDDEEQAEPIQYQPPRRNFTSLIVASTVFILALLVAIVVYHSTLPERSYGCGSTPEEARAKGCHFELTGSSWLHKDCYDPETEAEFLAFHDWKFFSDNNYTQEVPLSDVRKGNGNGYYVTQEYHGTHCAFLMKKFHRAVSEGRETRWNDQSFASYQSLYSVVAGPSDGAVG